MPDDNPSRPTPTPSSTGPVSTTASASRSGTCRRTRRRPLPSFLSRSLHPQGLGASTTRRAPLLRYHPLPIVGIPFASTDRLSGLPFSLGSTPTAFRRPYAPAKRKVYRKDDGTVLLVHRPRDPRPGNNTSHSSAAPARVFRSDPDALLGDTHVPRATTFYHLGVTWTVRLLTRFFW